jgi:hypothetical protein
VKQAMPFLLCADKESCRFNTIDCCLKIMHESK